MGLVTLTVLVEVPGFFVGTCYQIFRVCGATATGLEQQSRGRSEFRETRYTSPTSVPQIEGQSASHSHPIPPSFRRCTACPIPPMKITALLVLKSPGDDSSSSAGGEQQAVMLANASDVSHFGYFQRPAAREFILFVARTVALRTPAGRRQSVQHEEYKVHCYNQSGLCAIAFTDDHYPVRSAFSLLNMVLEEYQKTFGESWRTAKTDAAQPWQYLNDALTKYQDPVEADKLLKIQRDLDETKIILHKTIDSVLARGERLDSLVEKSSDLSAASQMFYKQAKKTNSCCAIL